MTVKSVKNKARSDRRAQNTGTADARRRRSAPIRAIAAWVVAATITVGAASTAVVMTPRFPAYAAAVLVPSSAEFQTLLTNAQTARTELGTTVANLQASGIPAGELESSLALLDNDIASIQALADASSNITSINQLSALQSQYTNLLTTMQLNQSIISSTIDGLQGVLDPTQLADLQAAFTKLLESLTGLPSALTDALITLISDILGIGGLTSGITLGEVDEETALEDDQHVDTIRSDLGNNYMAGVNGITEQFTTAMMQQVFIFGSFLDAKHQMETMRLLQDMDAQIHKKFQPSFQMCVMGTNTRGLARAQSVAEANTAILNNAMMARATQTRAGMTGESQASDIEARLKQYTRLYCDPRDNNGQMAPICPGATDPARRNRDIDFTRLVDGPLTLNINFTDATLTPEEEDVLALSRNLFNHRQMDFLPEDMLQLGPIANMGPAAWVWQNARSLQAVRSVAQNSFAHLVGMKTAGTHENFINMSQILQEMGMPEADIEQMIGPNPSYFAQMEMLTKRLYMTPDFFVNLFTKPANVERLGASLQAIQLMQDRDRYEAALRREMLISMIVEMKLRRYEASVDNTILGSSPSLFIQ